MDHGFVKTVKFDGLYVFEIPSLHEWLGEDNMFNHQYEAIVWNTEINNL